MPGQCKFQTFEHSTGPSSLDDIVAGFSLIVQMVNTPAVTTNQVGELPEFLCLRRLLERGSRRFARRGLGSF